MSRHTLRRRRTDRRTLLAAIATTIALDALAIWGITRPPVGPDTSTCALVAGSSIYCR